MFFFFMWDWLGRRPGTLYWRAAIDTRTHTHTFHMQVCVCQIPAEHSVFEQASLLKCLIRAMFKQEETATYQHTTGIRQSLQRLICSGTSRLLGGSHTCIMYAHTKMNGRVKTPRQKDRQTHPHRQQASVHYTGTERSAYFTLIQLTMTFPLCSRCRSS